MPLYDDHSNEGTPPPFPKGGLGGDSSNTRVISLVLAGNLLDYYDFMLFAHIGAVLTGVFMPTLDPKQTHLLSLLIFSIPFVVRPFGGYFFGMISDKFGRGVALGQTLKFASLASFGIAFLPGYEIGGGISLVLFILLRGLQGLSLGGEYTTAGTVLMEKYSTRRSFLSALVGSSGTVGSLIAFGFSWFYLNDYFPEEAWRYAFGVGALVTYISFLLRKQLKKDMEAVPAIQVIHYPIAPQKAIAVSLSVGLLVGVMFYFPMVYSNFYLTKILGYPASTGLFATLTALVGSIVMTPFFGLLADRYSPERIMTLAAFLSIPAAILGFTLIENGNLWGQVILIGTIAMFGAPTHALLNPLFAAQSRSRYVNTCFMLGTSLGSLAPFVSGYIASEFAFHHAPMLLVILTGLLTFIVFYRAFQGGLPK